jgi:hypothetical protein
MNDDWTNIRESHLLDKQNHSASLKNMTFSEVKRYFTAVIGDVKYNLEVLGGKETIWPDECDDAISNLSNANAFVQRICEVFNSRYHVIETPVFPGSVLVVKLYYAHAQLGKLQELVTAFQPICRASSKRARKQRAEILSKLELFMLHSDDIIQSMTLFQEETLLAKSIHSSLPLVLLEKTEQQTCRPQKFTGRAFDRLPSRKLHPSYVVLVKDGFVEERDAPRRRLVEEDQATSSETEHQEPASPLAGDTRSLVSSTSDCGCAVTDSCMPPLKLESEQQSKEDLRDEGPFCS